MHKMYCIFVLSKGAKLQPVKNELTNNKTNDYEHNDGNANLC